MQPLGFLVTGHDPHNHDITKELPLLSGVHLKPAGRCVITVARHFHYAKNFIARALVQGKSLTHFVVFHTNQICKDG